MEGNLMISEYLLNSIDNGILLCDCGGTVKIMNSAFQNLFRKMTGKTAATTIFEVDPLFRPETMGSGEHISRQITLRELHFNADIYQVSYLGDCCYLYLFATTIVSSEILETVLNLIDDAIGIANSQGVLEQANKAFVRITGTSGEKLLGVNVKQLLHMMETESIMLRVLREKKPLSMNVKYKNGRIVTHTAVPLFNTEGEIERVVATGRDISELLRLEERLKEAEQLESRYYTKLQEIRNQFGLHDVIYSSEQMGRIILMAIKVAQTDSSVFIMGESGVGKEVIARLIHDTCPRKNRPFVAINCAAIPSELLESELFGYEDGAFTGARKGGSKGLFAEANGGTVFLDEIGELPLKLQSKLLRVVQEKGFVRLGGNEFVSLDVRYIAATNLTKAQLKDGSAFRQDLYYRLCVVPIHIPPLRERREDILPLANYFLRFFNIKYQSKVSLSRGVLELLYRHNWEGNVRELKNIIERLVILSEGEKLTEDDFWAICNFGNGAEKGAAGAAESGTPLKEAQISFTNAIIEKAIKECGSVVKAAQMLNIAPSTIYRKMKKGEIGSGY